MAGTATVILLSFLLFYSPTVLTLFSRGDEPHDLLLMNIVMASTYTLIFYLNYFRIVPDTIFRNDRKLLFFLVNIILVVLGCMLVPIWFESHGGLPRPRHLEGTQISSGQYVMGYFRFVIRDGIMMILAIAMAYALRLSEWRESMRRRELELNAERRQIELKSLKAQLNPHFLFNSLNNIYALIAISPDRAQKALHDLSGMLRFMIYDAAHSEVLLEKEMQFIADYVELMKLRLNDTVKLTCEIDRKGTEGLAIAPLLFLTLVENAFKHVGRQHDSSFISIRILLNEGNVICEVTNSTSDEEHLQNLSRNESGIGLSNVERQLKLLYPGHATLSTSNRDGIFTAMITIDKEALPIFMPKSTGNPGESEII